MRVLSSLLPVVLLLAQLYSNTMLFRVLIWKAEKIITSSYSGTAKDQKTIKNGCSHVRNYSNWYYDQLVWALWLLSEQGWKSFVLPTINWLLWLSGSSRCGPGWQVWWSAFASLFPSWRKGARKVKIQKSNKIQESGFSFHLHLQHFDHTE